MSWLLRHRLISVLHLQVWHASWIKMYWRSLARADDQCGWCSTNCQILCFSDRPEVASLRWVSWYRDSSQIWHLNGASKRNTETPQLSQGTHSYLEIYSANFHLLLMFTNISGFLAYVLYLKLLSKYFLGPLFKVSWAAQFRCLVLKIKIFFWWSELIAWCELTWW